MSQWLASYHSLPNHGSRGKKKKFADTPLCPLSLVVLASKQSPPMKMSVHARCCRRQLWCCRVVVVVGAGSGAGRHHCGWCWWPWLMLQWCGGGSHGRGRCGWWWSTIDIDVVVVRSSLLSVVVVGCGCGVLVVIVVVVEEFEVQSSKIEQVKPCDSFP